MTKLSGVCLAAVVGVTGLGWQGARAAGTAPEAARAVAAVTAPEMAAATAPELAATAPLLAAAYGGQDRDDRVRDQGGWDTPPSEYTEIERKGFHDGMEGARKDAENHRSMNVRNRDEYRKPDDIKRRDLRAYRRAFERGYRAGWEHLRERR